jgi:hypothetical protein
MGEVFLVLAVMAVVVYIIIVAYVAKARSDQAVAQWHYECMRESYEEGRRFERSQMKREQGE